MLLCSGDGQCDFFSSTDDWTFTRSFTHGAHTYDDEQVLEPWRASFRYLPNAEELIDVEFRVDPFLSHWVDKPCFRGHHIDRNTGMAQPRAFCVVIRLYWMYYEPQAAPNRMGNVLALLDENMLGFRLGREGPY